MPTFVRSIRAKLNPASRATSCATPPTRARSRDTVARSSGVGSIARLCLAAGLAFSAIDALSLRPTAEANDRRIFLQYFETSWRNIENRAPDIFMSGYAALWLPPISKASFGSPGFDPFDRFDLGSPASPTIYGTEQSFRQMIQELRAADVQSFPDIIMNHNGGRTNDAGFIAAGGWPGFYLPGSGSDFWGDFHDGSTQSINPSGSNYNLFTGDLVGLIDIAQEKNYQFIRHPIGPNAQNIPPGTQRNLPDPNNRRFYPDRGLTPLTFTNFGAQGDGASWTVYPFNTTNPLSPTATPIAENATGLLIRWCQWMIDVQQVDGFRLDAAKHIPVWFWNNYYDPIVYQRRITPWGARSTPFSFGESVESNAFVQQYIRNKDGFGNRDALDLNEAGQLRDILNAGGLGSWLNVLNASIDLTDDGFNNGSQGVHHAFSHDNGTVGNGSSAPAVPTARQQGLPSNAYVLFRSGVPLVYHNSREMHTRFSSRGFWPREGNSTALGDGDNNLRRLVQIAQAYVRADNANLPSAPKSYFSILNSSDPVNTSLNDVLVFERTNWNSATQPASAIGTSAAASVIVALNDRYDPESAGTRQVRNVQTSFAAGTRLIELSGAAADPVVNNAGLIPSVITVDSNRRVTLTVPNNLNSLGTEHNRGYVVYGPAQPAGTLQTLNIDPTTSARSAPTPIPADDASVPSFRRRTTPIDIITTPTFEIRLDTVPADPGEPNKLNNCDDFAVFKINQGFRDFNGNGNFDQPSNVQVDGGFEQFLTQASPISGPNGTGTTGLYRQVINTSLLSEGTHYLVVQAYKRRTDGGAPIFTAFRKVFYVDRQAPQVALQDITPNTPPQTGFTLGLATGQNSLRVIAADRTTTDVWIILNAPVGTDATTLINAGNKATQFDRLEWQRNPGTIPPGNNAITVVARELSGRFSVTRYDNVAIPLGSGDVNLDGFGTIDDLYSSWLLGSTYQGEADLDRNGVLNANDRRLHENFLRPSEAVNMKSGQR